MSDCEKCTRVCGLNLADEEKEDAEKSLIIIKPDGIQKKVAGKVITRFEDAGFEIERMKMIHIDKALATRHYKDHTEKAFFEPLIKYICSGPVIVMVIKGDGAIKKARELMGPTDSKVAPPGTIRGDFGVDTTINVVHGSDCQESANREIGIFFG